MKEPDMLQSLLNTVFACSHRRTTFPITPGRKSASHRNTPYVVCLDCGKEFAYNWNEMRVGEQVPPRPATTEAQPMFR
jgi:hypothetical protein